MIDPKYPTTKTDKEAAIARAEARIGERNYKLLANNCENFARGVLVPGAGFSRQAMNVIAGVGGVMFFYAEIFIRAEQLIFHRSRILL